MSISGFEEVLSFSKKILRDGANDGSEKFWKLLISQWPKSWSKTMVILKTCRFQDPTEYWICFSRENDRRIEWYIGMWGVAVSDEKSCRNCWNSCDIPYYYLTLTVKCNKWFVVYIMVFNEQERGFIDRNMA